MASKYFEIVQSFVDSFGVFSQKNGDGGDSFEREGLFLLSEKLHLETGKITPEEFQSSQNRYKNVIKTLEVSSGNFLRNPDKSKWYGQPDRMSRDQLTSNIVGMGFADRRMLTLTFLGHLLKRALLFTTNTRPNFVMPGDAGYKWKLPDLTFAAILGAYIRGFNVRFLLPLSYLILTITDLELLVNSYLICAKVKADPTFADQLSHLCLLWQSELVTPTLTSKWAVQVYSRCPWCQNPPSGKIPQTQLQSVFNLYFDQSTGAAPFDEVFKDLVL